MFPPPPLAHPAPGPVRALRVLVWLQVALLLVGAVLGLALAAASSTGLRGDDESQAWAGLGVFLGLVFAGIALVGAALFGIPVFLLRDGRRGTKVGALGIICGLEALLVLGILITSVYSITRVGASSVVVPLLGAAFAAVIVVLGLQPTSREWAART